MKLSSSAIHDLTKDACDQQCRLRYMVHLLLLAARLRAEGGRGVGEPRPGLIGRLRGGEAMVMPLASSLGASHVPQSAVPLLANSCKQVHQLKLQQATGCWRLEFPYRRAPSLVSLHEHFGSCHVFGRKVHCTG